MLFLPPRARSSLLCDQLKVTLGDLAPDARLAT
jgi:hypothetical protein